MWGNQGGMFQNNQKLIFLAKKGGAHAAKFQTYKAEKIAKINSKAYWDTTKEKTKSQFELFSKFDKFTPNNYRELAKYCKKIKIDLNYRSLVGNYDASVGIQKNTTVKLPLLKMLFCLKV